MSDKEREQFAELAESRDHLNAMNAKLEDEETKAMLIRLIDEVMTLRARVSRLEQKDWQESQDAENL